MKKKQISVVLALFWFILSFVLLTIPGSKLPKEDWFDKIWFDKWVHIGMFAILAALWCRSLSAFRSNTTLDRLRQAFILVGLICLSYGVSMEFVQKYFVSNRSFDIGDILADGVGSFLGSAFSIRKYIKK